MEATTLAVPHVALVVEDNPPTRRAMAMLLTHMGWRVIAVGSVAEALKSLDARPLCMILDLMLPDGNGLTVLRHVRINQLPIRVAVATGTNDPAMLSEVAALKPDALYRKPLDTAAMQEWLATC